MSAQTASTFTTGPVAPVTDLALFSARDVKVNLSAVLESYNRVDGQKQANDAGARTLRTLRIEAAQITYRAVKVDKIITTTALGNVVKDKRDVSKGGRKDWAAGTAFTSSAGVTYFAVTGHLLSLPGNLPDDANVMGLSSIISRVTVKRCETIFNRKGMTVETAYAAIKKISDDMLEKEAAEKEEKSAPDAAKLLTSAASMVKKAMGMELNDEALALALALQAALSTGLATAAADRAAQAAQAAQDAAQAAADAQTAADGVKVTVSVEN